MKTYLVIFNWRDYFREVTRVYANNKREIRPIMRNFYGKGVKVLEIEEIDW